MRAQKPGSKKQAAFLTASLVGLLLALHATAADRVRPLSKKIEITVKLFGQDCKMSGPWDAAVLTRVHAISPERIPERQPLAATQTAIQLVRASSDIPNALDLYREKLLKRLEQQAAFQSATAEAKKTKSLQPIRDALQKKLNTIEREKLDTALRSVSSKEFKVTSWDAAFTDRLSDAVEVAIQAYPEEDYHRTTRKLGIEYACVSEIDPEEEQVE